jgi:NAD-dependent histone deacetylase SIR2
MRRNYDSFPVDSLLAPPSLCQPQRLDFNMSASSSPLSSPLSSPQSSPLSSVASRSPSPPVDYPSPPSSNLSDTGATSKIRDAQDTPDREGPPPAKRQRTMKSKELNTEYLNLRALNDSDDEMHHNTQEPKLRKLMEVLRSKRKIVVVAGAGISVSAGSMSPFSLSP